MGADLIGVPQRRSIVAALSVAAAIAVVLGVLFYATGGRVAYTMDSLTYRDVALHFLSGQSIQSSNVTTLAPVLEPFLNWPPAYPALWAVWAAVTGAGSIDAVPVQLNLVLLAISTLAVFWLGWMVTGQPLSAALLATVSGLVPTHLIVYGHAWSEALFIPMLLLAYACFWKYRITSGRFVWLVMAALLIGGSNWVRYAGVAFLPLLGLSVLVASASGIGRRIVHAAAAVLLGLGVVFPLWLRNWQLSGHISGSTRGGMPRSSRWMEDAVNVIDLIEHVFFSFSMVLRANLEVPMLLLAAWVAYRAFRRCRLRWLRPPEVWLPLVWAGGYVLFLLYARRIQTTIDLDLRMLAVAFPFILLAMLPALKVASLTAGVSGIRILVALWLGLLACAGLQEADRVRQSYAADAIPRWRSAFGLGYRDLSATSPTSLALVRDLTVLAPSTLVLTDFRALYLRYLTGLRVYAPQGDACGLWSSHPGDVVLFIGAKDLPGWAADCLHKQPQWRLLRPTGKAVPSMYAD
ncbi:hypothetical protein [Polaromonas sp. YR568]|uniref:hypothetical protein n=1 Tax=Polaromonas sp. YR568 TaxID=1855301 RepID=UPI003137C5FB